MKRLLVALWAFFCVGPLGAGIVNISDSSLHIDETSANFDCLTMDLGNLDTEMCRSAANVLAIRLASDHTTYGSLQVDLLAGAGSVTVPGIMFNADNDGTGTGFYRSATNTWSFSANAARVLTFSANGITVERNALGAASGNGLKLENNTAATAGNPQWSPSMSWLGTNYDSSDGLSHTLEFRWELETDDYTLGIDNNSKLALKKYVDNIAIETLFTIDAQADGVFPNGTFTFQTLFSDSGAINSDGAGSLQVKQLVSTQATGAPPFVVNSTDVVANLHATNSDQLGGVTAASFPQYLTGVTGSISGALTLGVCDSGTASIIGARNTMAVIATPTTYPGDGAIWMAYVSSNDVVTVKECGLGVITPAVTSYQIRIIK